MFKITKEKILSECDTALNCVDEAAVEDLIKRIMDADKVFFVGVGRVKLSLEAFAKRLNHLGISAHVVGDINEPAMTDRDLLIVGSGSGESLVPVVIARKAKEIGGSVVHIGSNSSSTIASMADLIVRIPVQTKLYLKDEIQSEQPMSSLFEQSLLLLADTVSMMIVEKNNVDIKSLWQFHANLE